MTDEMEDQNLEQTASGDAEKELHKQQEEETWDGAERRKGKERREFSYSYSERNRRSGRERRKKPTAKE